MPISAASSVLTRSQSMPSGEPRPASPLARQLSEARGGGADPARSRAATDPADFKAQYTRDSVATLFAASPDARALDKLYLASPNVYAQLEIAEFAKVYAQLLKQCSQEGKEGKESQALNDLAKQYTARILNDGLGAKSAFGPWTQRTNKQYQLRNQLEHKLAQLASEHCGGDAMKLGDKLMHGEVSLFILSYVETQLGRSLDEATGRQVIDLVDRAARQAFTSLRQSRSEMLGLSGPSLGRQARDLDTVAILPQLLRGVLDGLVPDPKSPEQPRPVRDEQPEPQPKPDPGPAESGETPRPQEVHYHFNFNDNSQDNRQDNRRWNKRGDTYLGDARNGNRHYGGAPSRLVTSLRMPTPQVARSQALPTPQQAAVSEARHPLLNAASQVTGALSALMSTALGEETLTAPTPGAAQAGKLETTARQARLDPPATPQFASLGDAPSGVERSVQTDAGSALRDAAGQVAGALSELMKTALGEAGPASPAPGEAQAGQPQATAQPKAASLDGESAGEFAALAFRGGPLRNLPSQAYLRSQIFHSTVDGHAAGRELIKALRDALEPDAAQPFAQRREFEALRKRILPNDRIEQDGLLRQFADGAPEALAADARRLGEVLAGHPGLERQRQALGGFAQTLMRETNLLPSGGRVNPLLGEFLAGLGLQPRKASAEDAGARLHQAASEVASGLSKVLNAADGRQAASEPTADAAADRAAEPDGGGFGGLKFRDGNLYTLPTQAYLRSRAFALDAGGELIRAVRGALEPDATQPFAQRREFEALRNRVLPGNSTQQSGVLKDFADGKAGALGDDAAQLRQVLAEHPGLARQRQALSSFARTLIREANLLPRGKPANPLVTELLSGLGIDAAAEARRGEALSPSSGVTLTTDGLHLDPKRSQERNHVRRS
ncbi:hypothetical protein ACPRNU_09155 [Chromobacterium vaccinii]|uniref:hypothetical protein n=1 Tax=Chromobacterium vaccinii TaxID=1108595 RepID=UPI003C76D3C9